MEKSQPPALLFTLFFILFQTVFSTTLPLMAGVYIAEDLGGSRAILTYAISFYSLGNGLGVPFGRPLASRLGTVNLITSCLFLYALLTLACGLAPNLPIFIFYRLLQGVVGGPIIATIVRFISLLFPERDKTVLNSIVITIFAVGPVVGATWGGFIAYELDWRYIFYANVPLLIIAALFLGFKMRQHEETITPTPFDVVGSIFYCIAATCCFIAIITGQELDWFRSNLITGLIVGGALSLLFFILWSLRHPYPFLAFDLFRKPAFLFAIINLAILFSTYFGMVILIALWLNLDVDYTPIWIGILLSHMAIAGALPSLLLGRRLARIDCRYPLAIALLCFAGSAFHTMFFNVEINFGRIAFSRILLGFGLAFFLPSLFRLCFHSFSEERAGDVTGVFQVVRSFASCIGTAVYTTMWLRREVFYHERLGSALTLFSSQTKNFFNIAERIHLKGGAANARLAQLLDRQSTALALDDCFYFFGLITVGLIVMLALTSLLNGALFKPESRPPFLKPE